MTAAKKLLAVVVYLIITAVGCDSQLSPAIKLNGNNSLVTKFNGHYHKGNVQLTTTPDNQLFVGLNKNDNSFERMFILQSQSLPVFEKSIDNAELIFMHDGLVINSLDEKNTMILTIADNETDLEYYNSLKKRVGTIEQVFTGYGLNNFTNDLIRLDIEVVKNTGNLYFDINTQIIKKKKDIANARVPDDGGGDGGTTCLAGGCGSSECSYSVGTVTCSVKCKDLWHACCQSPLICKCREDKTWCAKE
jgi:hypothetical protein